MTSFFSELQDKHFEFSRVLGDSPSPLVNGLDAPNDIAIVLGTLELFLECRKEGIERGTGVDSLISVDEPGFGLAAESGTGMASLVFRSDFGKVHIFFDFIGPRVDRGERRVGTIKFRGPWGLGEREVGRGRSSRHVGK